MNHITTCALLSAKLTIYRLYIPRSLSVCKEMKRFSTKESDDNDFERI